MSETLRCEINEQLQAIRDADAPAEMPVALDGYAMYLAKGGLDRPLGPGRSPGLPAVLAPLSPVCDAGPGVRRLD